MGGRNVKIFVTEKMFKVLETILMERDSMTVLFIMFYTWLG